MINAFRVEKFKAFKDTGNIDLKPLTVLAGNNSSGKSSLLQSLLLLKQTLETSAAESVELNLSGRFLQFSSLSEIAYRKPPKSRAEVGYSFDVISRMPSLLVSRYFPSHQRVRTKFVPVSTEISFAFRERQVALNETSEERPQIVVDRFRMATRLNGEVGPTLSFAFRPSTRSRSVKMSGAGIRLPAGYQGRRITGVSTTAFIPDGLLLEAKEREGETVDTRARLDVAFSAPLRILDQYLRSRTYYLGPLREEPHRAYLHSGSPFPEIGAKGEYAAQVLWLERDKNVIYQPGGGMRRRNVSLLDAVNDAFKRLGVDHKMDVRSWQSLMYQIVAGIRGGKEVTIADVGFGVSQLLPILVLALRAPERSILLFEQPEIHLHPRVQANLADSSLAQRS